MTNFFVYNTRLIKPIKATKVRLEALGSMTDSSKHFIELVADAEQILEGQVPFKKSFEGACIEPRTSWSELQSRLC